MSFIAIARPSQTMSMSPLLFSSSLTSSFLLSKYAIIFSVVITDISVFAVYAVKHPISSNNLKSLVNSKFSRCP